MPQGCYRADGDDRWLVLSICDDADWVALCNLLGRPDLGSLSRDDRQARHNELDEVIEGWTAERSDSELQVTLQSHGLAAAAVVTTLDLYDDPQLVHRRFHQVVPNPKMHPYRQSGPTWRLQDSPPHQMTRSPFFGEHNEHHLMEGLGLDRQEMERLEKLNVIGSDPLNPSVG